jgi:hypothetical protein
MSLKAYYEQDNILVREPMLEDAYALAQTMKPEDMKEIWASHRHTPEEALLLSLQESEFCATVVFEGEPVAMFGVCPTCLVSNEGTVWLLSSEKLFDHSLRFVRHSRHFIDMMLGYKKYLYNYVHNDNRKSIAWLLRMGATIEQPEPFGADGELFRYFHFKRN